MKFLDRHELQRRDTQIGEVLQPARHVEERAALAWQVRREKGADVELIDDELVKSRRDVPALMPGKVGASDDALAGERRLQFAGTGIALESLPHIAPLAYHIEHVALTILHAWNEAPPMSLLIAREQRGIVAHPVVEVSDHMHGSGMRSPATKCGAVGDQVGAHRGAGVNVIE